MEIPYTTQPREDTGLYNAKVGIWLFLASEVMLFGALFSSYILLRVGAPAGFWPQGWLNVPVGTVNTLVLITSSITTVMAWASLKMNHFSKFRFYHACTLLCALTFVCIKSYEYHDKFTHYELTLNNGKYFDGHLVSSTLKMQDGAWTDQKKAPEFLATIMRHTEQLTNLVSDILELSKLESTGMHSRRSAVDLDLVVHRAFELLVPAAQRKNNTLTLDVAHHLPAIKGNADYIERAVSNLIDNAVKYTPEGGKVHVRVSSTPMQVVVEVSDNGLGIPKEDLPRIFERFYRVDRSRSREMGGTGLGLSIVKHVMQVHGGAIEVDSCPGKGSTFRLKFPVG